MANPTDPYAQQKFEDELRFLSHDYYIRRALEQVPPLNVIDFNGVFSDRAIALIGQQQLTGQRAIGNRDYRMFASAPPPPGPAMPDTASGPGEATSPKFTDLDLQRILLQAGIGIKVGAAPLDYYRGFVSNLENSDLLGYPRLRVTPTQFGSLTPSEAELLLLDAVYNEIKYRQSIGTIGPGYEDIGYGDDRAAGVPGYYAKKVAGGFVFVPFGLAIEDSFAGIVNAGQTGFYDAPLPTPGGIPGGAIIGGIIAPNGEPGTTFPQVPIRPPVNPGTPGAPPGGIPGIPDGLFQANPADP